MKTIAILAILTFAVAILPAFAQTPQLYDRETGKYLGNLGGNKYDYNSTENPYGPYGSEYSADSIKNPYGQYGSEYSSDSPNNPYASSPPVIIVPALPTPPSMPSF